jgi:hypothetical protein
MVQNRWGKIIMYMYSVFLIQAAFVYYHRDRFRNNGILIDVTAVFTRNNGYEIAHYKISSFILSLHCCQSIFLKSYQHSSVRCRKLFWSQWTKFRIACRWSGREESQWTSFMFRDAICWNIVTMHTGS